MLPAGHGRRARGLRKALPRRLCPEEQVAGGTGGVSQRRKARLYGKKAVCLREERHGFTARKPPAAPSSPGAGGQIPAALTTAGRKLLAVGEDPRARGAVVRRLEAYRVH